MAENRYGWCWHCGERFRLSEGFGYQPDFEVFCCEGCGDQFRWSLIEF